MEDWLLEDRMRVTGGEISYRMMGDGSPVVLVHGTPSRSYIWRRIAPVLAERHTVYAFDLLGFGDSEAGEGQEVSIAAQGRALAELIESLELENPAVAGHDIGGGTVLRAHLVEEVPFERIALLDSVVLTPWGTPTLKHVQAHMEAYRTMPLGPFEAIVASHLRTATSKPLEQDAFEAYLSQWQEEEGKTAYLRKDTGLDEEDTRVLEPLLSGIDVPVRIIWGEDDGWLPIDQAVRLNETIRGSRLERIAGAGHFVMEDAPEEVSGILAEFFE